MRPEIQPMPKTIVKALADVQKSVEAVAKSQFNKQGGYKFASADDIYAAITRKMGQVGLVIMPLELEQPEIKRFEVDARDQQGNPIKKTQQWGKFRFGFMLACDDDTWFDERSSRSLYIQILGPQTFNAAESYAQKQFLRGLFKLPTGDMDLDSMPTAETVEDQAAFNEPKKRKSSAAAKRDGGSEKFNEIGNAIRDATSADMLRHLRDAYDDDWRSLPARWEEELNEAYEYRMRDLGGHNGSLV